MTDRLVDGAPTSVTDIRLSTAAVEARERDYGGRGWWHYCRDCDCYFACGTHLEADLGDAMRSSAHGSVCPQCRGTGLTWLSSEHMLALMASWIAPCEHGRVGEGFVGLHIIPGPSYEEIVARHREVCPHCRRRKNGDCSSCGDPRGATP